MAYDVPTFRVGDLVRLKSGGPPLTVALITDAGLPVVAWFAGDELRVQTAMPQTLVPIPEEGGGGSRLSTH